MLCYAGYAGPTYLYLQVKSGRQAIVVQSCGQYSNNEVLDISPF